MGDSRNRHRLCPDYWPPVWVRVNQLLDRDEPIQFIAHELPIDIDTVMALQNPRRCIERYDHDYERLRKCIEGREEEL